MFSVVLLFSYYQNTCSVNKDLFWFVWKQQEPDLQCTSNKAALEETFPRLLDAAHRYPPLSILLTVVIVNSFLSCERLILVELSFESKGNPFLVHDIVGDGFPVALQVKVTLSPSDFVSLFGWADIAGLSAIATQSFYQITMERSGESIQRGALLYWIKKKTTPLSCLSKEQIFFQIFPLRNCIELQSTTGNIIHFNRCNCKWVFPRKAILSIFLNQNYKERNFRRKKTGAGFINYSFTETVWHCNCLVKKIKRTIATYIGHPV